MMFKVSCPVCGGGIQPDIRIASEEVIYFCSFCEFCVEADKEGVQLSVVPVDLNFDADKWYFSICMGCSA